MIPSLFLLVLVVAARPVEPPETLQTAFQIQPGRFHLDADEVEIHVPAKPVIAPFVVLALSCIIAFLALATLYIIIKSLRSQMLTAWKLLPRHLLGGDRLLPLPNGDDKHLSDSDSDSEKYQDALDVDDPPLPHTESPPPALSMRESCPSRPAWSVRAIDSPALGLPARQGTDDDDSVASESPPPRRRAYRSTVPDLDVALAMQLRPGLGIGADSAWMVRFLMTIFGWFAVVLTSNGR